MSIDHLSELLNITPRKSGCESGDNLACPEYPWLAILNHELRTPLNAIAGFADLLVTAEEVNEKQRYARIIKENSHWLEQEIDDVLELLKLEAGNCINIYTEVNLFGFLYERMCTAKKQLPDSEVEVILDVSDTSATVSTDIYYFSLVFNHLIENAIKFTQQGYIRLGYQLMGKKYRFYVSDTGCGIPQKYHPDIFDCFVKLDQYVPGLGIGLTICRIIVKQLGGEIGVDSEPEKGSVFWFTLPVK